MTRTPTQKNEVTSARLTLEAPVSRGHPTSDAHPDSSLLAHPRNLNSRFENIKFPKPRVPSTPYERCQGFPQRETIFRLNCHRIWRLEFGMRLITPVVTPSLADHYRPDLSSLWMSVTPGSASISSIACSFAASDVTFPRSVTTPLLTWTSTANRLRSGW